MLEIVIVLSIIVLVAGSVTPVITGMVRAEQLKAPARSLEAMAITARTNAISEQRPYRIVLDERSFRLEQPVPGGSKEPIASFQIPSGVDFQIASWPDETWVVPRNRVWHFPSSGLCEPIQTSFTKGDSYVSQRFSPVTGWEQDYTSFFR